MFWNVLSCVVDADQDPGSQTREKPCGSGSRSDFKVTKSCVFMKNILKVGNRSKNIQTKVQKPFGKAGNQVNLKILVNFLVPDPDLHSQYGSGSTTAKWVRILIHNTGFVLNLLSASNTLNPLFCTLHKTRKIIFTFQANCLRHTAIGQAVGAVVGWSCRSREYRLQKQWLDFKGTI